MTRRRTICVPSPAVTSDLTTPAPILIGLPITSAGQPVATIQHGIVGSHPLHAAACRFCGAAVCDRPSFDAALWIREHLSDVHGVDVVMVDARRLARQESGPRARQIAQAVAQLAASWGDTDGTPLVAIEQTRTPGGVMRNPKEMKQTMSTIKRPNAPKVTRIGNLTRDPELRYSAKGAAWVTTALAVDRRVRNDGGRVGGHVPPSILDLVCFGGLAEDMASLPDPW